VSVLIYRNGRSSRRGHVYVITCRPASDKYFMLDVCMVARTDGSCKKASSCMVIQQSLQCRPSYRAPVAVVPCCRHVAPTVKGHMLMYVTRAKASPGIACLSLRSISARQCKYTAHSAARMHAFLVPDRSTSTRRMDRPPDEHHPPHTSGLR